MRTIELETTLERFAKQVISRSRSNLTKGKKNVSKGLYESLDYEVLVHPNSFTLSFEMEEYGAYQDLGVSGTKKKYDTLYSYTNKMPPHKPIFEWVKHRKLFLRDEKGRFSKGGQNSLTFLIRRSIYEQGIKPTKFFSRPFESAFGKLPDELIKAYGLDLEKFLKITTNNKRL